MLGDYFLNSSWISMCFGFCIYLTADTESVSVQDYVLFTISYFKSYTMNEVHIKYHTNNNWYICFRGFDENSSEGSSSPSHSEGSDVDDPELGTRIAELQRNNQLLQVSVMIIKNL